MSLLPELIIQDILVKGIRKAREEPWRVEQLYRTAPQSFVETFYKVLKDTPIDITLNYPREDSQFPCISILLRGEEEIIKPLGNVLGVGSTPTDLKITDEWFYSAGKTEAVETLGGNIAGETPRLFDTDKNTYATNLGSGFMINYLLQIMTDDQDFTVFLYSFIKLLLLSNLSYLEHQGLYDLSVSGTDFLPQVSQQPNFIFMRGINLRATYFAQQFVIPGVDDDEKLATSFVIDMEPNGESGVFVELQKPILEKLSLSEFDVDEE
mgnify:CR=1 FL=1